MKKRGKRVATMALCSLILASIGTSTMSAYAAEATNREEQSYVVVAESPEVCNRLSQKYGDNATPVSIQDDGILFLSLTEQEKKQLEKQENVQVEEDLIVTASGETADDDDVLSIPPEEQWNLNMVSAILAEDTGISDKELSKIKVAVLDSGVSFTTDIVVEKSVNLVPGEENVLPFYEDSTGHGTSVAGIIGAQNNGEGTTGVNPNATLYSVRVLDDNNEAPVSRVIEGIYWCIDNDVNIINMSFGLDSYNEALHGAVKAAEEAGILIIAAAGNGDKVQYPAAFPEVMAVGGVSAEGQPLYGNGDSEELNISAPGKAIPTAGFLDGIVEADGTSMAAPHVAGAASVLWAKNPNASAQFIRNLLEESTKENTEITADVGVLDLEYALDVYDVAENNAKNDKVVVPENEQNLQTFDEGTVNASWKVVDHDEAIVNYKRNNLPADMVQYVRYGIKAADLESIFRGEYSAFHGFTNYVSNSVYLAQIAKETERTGHMTDGINNISYPIADPSYMELNNGVNGNKKGYTEISSALKKLNTTAKWNEILGNKKILNGDNDPVKTTANLNSKRKAYFILGLSTHVALDTFAHKARVYNNGQWVSVKSISPAENGDQRDEYPNRYEVAVKVAYTILDRYTGTSSNPIDASVFYKPKYYPTPTTTDPDSFKLEGFKTYYKYCSTTLYQEQKDWIDARSVTTTN